MDNPPPCDTDFAQTYASVVPTIPVEIVTPTEDTTIDDDSDVIVNDEQPNFERPTHRAKSYDEALILQRILADRIKDPKTPDSDKARLVMAWDKLEDRKRILRGKPLPGSLSPTRDAKRSGLATMLSVIDNADTSQVA